MIEVTNLTRRFGDVTAVAPLSLRVPDGTILVLLGPNGAGKTTTVRMLAGLLGPSEGEARVAGHDIRRDPAGVRANVGLVTDVPGLHEQMTVVAYLHFFGSLHGLRGPACSRRVDELIDFFELGHHRKQPMVSFSKGMKQKVALRGPFAR
jgi:ABC-2 type transport system ATP-binding protein